MSLPTDPTPTELAVICGSGAPALEAAMARTVTSAHAGRLTPAQAVALAEELGVEQMGHLGARLVELARLRAADEAELEAAIEIIDDALSDWLARTHQPAPSFLEHARRALPDELYAPVAAVWENRGRGQRVPRRG